MKKVKEIPVSLSPEQEGLFPQIDFSDTFTTTNHQDSLKVIAHRVFDQSPKWVGNLFRLRNAIVKFFGLKTTLPPDYRKAYEVGGYVSFFKILKISDKELVMGANDSHLNFRAIIEKTDASTYNIEVTTLVEYNNRMGKIYMTMIKPFHRMVVIRMVGQAFSL